MIYKALSVSFEKKLLLGVVRSSEYNIAQKYTIRKYPTIILLINTEKKPLVYQGELNFNSIFEFLNVYS